MRGACGRRGEKVLAAGLLVLVLAVTASIAGGCGFSDEVGDGGTVSTVATSLTSEVTTTTAPSSTTTSMAQPTTTTVPAGDVITVNVYFGKQFPGDRQLVGTASRIIPRTQQVGTAAMKALLEGPTDAEKQAGMFSSIPDGTTLLGLDISESVATVDLSKEYASGGGSLSMLMRLAEVVFTLTQFPTVDGVSFKLDGQPITVLGGEGIIIDHPMSRADYEDMSPVILVESPTLGQSVASPLRVTGTANVFEAVFRLSVQDRTGKALADNRVQATAGTGTRGTFDTTISLAPGASGPATLTAYYDSPKDGSKVIVDQIPIMLGQ
jgi:germination protein M